MLDFYYTDEGSIRLSELEESFVMISKVAFVSRKDEDQKRIKKCWDF